MDYLSNYSTNDDTAEVEDNVAVDLSAEEQSTSRPCQESAAVSSTYSCSKCSWDNDISNRSCVICYFNRDGTEWECPRCESFTPARRVTCVSCSYRVETMARECRQQFSDPVVRENEEKKRKREASTAKQKVPRTNSTVQKNGTIAGAASAVSPKKTNHSATSVKKETPKNMSKHRRTSSSSSDSSNSSGSSASASPRIPIHDEEEFLPDNEPNCEVSYDTSSSSSATVRAQLVAHLRAKQSSLGPAKDPRPQAPSNQTNDRPHTIKLSQEEVARIRADRKDQLSSDTMRQNSRQYVPTPVSAPRRVPLSPATSQSYSPSASPASPPVPSAPTLDTITGQIAMLGNLFKLHQKIFDDQLEFLHSAHAKH